ncbi:sensor domain-containing diguanylate cyclase [Caldibacillus lycopersici]|uniref:Sensor domain-containing diguanylate cyclase n=1 Tax=Perspicuibacillus lycopersici TaxID=1325689 RepID=A0AAE3ITH3_9BACI|nr:sensor domain-containing diguanylate cyclase [Perspicuibacillus lycopersici]MCU9613159.1 sensor domain-containing diguanylate cyclase [Perspicuibacillus lycopersici]
MRKLIIRKYKLSTLLTFLVSGSVILTILILIGASYQSEKESLYNTYLTLNRSKANKISQSVNSLFEAMRMSLQDTTTFLEENNGMSDEEIQQQLQLVRKSSRYFNSLFWIDEKNRMQNISPLSVGIKGDKITNDVIQQAVASKRPALTIPFYSSTGRFMILMSEPFYDKEGNYRGIIGGTIYLQEKNVLYEILGNDISDKNGSYYYVVEQRGNILFHPDINLVGEKTKENPFVDDVLQEKSGAQVITNSAGIRMLAAYSTIPETGWRIIQQTPVSYVQKLLREHVEKLIFYIVPPFLALLLLSLFITRLLAKPFVQLADMVRQFGDGQKVNTPVKPTRWNREAHLLTDSLLTAIDSVQKHNTKLTVEAMTDPLTKLPNRRSLNTVMDRLVNDKQLFTLISIDIDHFKSINDTYGHQAGDEVLRDFAQTVQSVIRKTNRLFRYGGEEFVLILPNTKTEKAYYLAEMIRITIANSMSPIGKPITISIGISEFPAHAESYEKIFRNADIALYQSKIEGRNRTTIWSKDKE